MPKKYRRKALESDDAKLISAAFDCGIAAVRKMCRNKKAAKIYDFDGIILKRRKAAALSYLNQVRGRYGATFPKSELDHAWAEQNCAMGHSVDGLDHFYYFTLAIAVWMLDALKHSGRMVDAFQYFTKEPRHLDAVRLPDMLDPCHDETVIRGMMDLIQERDERDNPFQWYISDATAKRKAPVDHSAPPADPANLTPRERFNAVMDMIHPVLKERAARRFEEKMWEFLDRLFHCAGESAELCASLQEKSGKLFQECLALHGRLFSDRGTGKKPVSAAAVLNPQSILIRPSNLMSPGFDVMQALDSPTYRGGLQEDDYDRLTQMSKYGLCMQDELDEAEETLSCLICTAHMAPLMTRGELEDNLGAEITDQLLAFEVEDPYEICFGYLCLIEAGSDLPWLYNASLAVLIAAVRKLPWNALNEGPDAFDETDECSEDGEVDDLNWIECDTSSETQPVAEPKDWNHKKADLYRLAYSDKPLLFPDDLSEPERRINLPQMIYGLTGIVMPRNVSDFDEMAEELAAAGMEPGLAKGMELYLQLAFETQYFREDRFPQSDRLSISNDLHDETEEAVPGAELTDIENLRHSLKDARAEIDSLRTELHQVRKEGETKRKEADRILREAAGERQELVSLRELIYRHANENEYEEVPDQGETELPYTPQKRTVVFGGHDTWLKAIRPMLPGVTFVPKEQNPNANMISAAETVWIQPNALSHKNYYKIINIVRQNQVPVHYFGYASARKCAWQLAENDQGE